jgi:cytochrome-b5 reductase
MDAYIAYVEKHLMRFDTWVESLVDRIEENSTFSIALMFLVAVITMLALGNFLGKFVFGDSQKALQKRFLVPEQGGALQNMPKQDNGHVALKLAEKIKITQDTYIFRFAFRDLDMTFGLPVGNHVFFKAKIDGEDV